jgi:ABC-type nitrate/sulfonate/bicarbonate transport system substrate-binding protein
VRGGAARSLHRHRRALELAGPLGRRAQGQENRHLQRRLVRFLAAWLDATDYIAAHKAETVRIESEITGFSPAVMTKEYDITTHLFSKDCKFDAESLANLKRAFVDQKLVETPPDMSKLYTEAFLPKR